jgi:exonuclease SbcC
LESLTSDEAAEALKWLAIWERKLPLIPTAPKIPTKKLDAKAVASLQQQLENFVNEAEEWWDKADSRIKARLKTFNEAERTRKAQEIALGHDSEQLVQIKAEIKVLAQNITAKETEANQHDAAVGDLVKQVGKLNDALKPFTNLDADLKGEQKKRDSTRDGHERYIGAKKLADDLGARQTRLKQFQSEEAAAQLALQTAAAALRKAEQDFDSSKLEPARVDHRGKHDRAIALKVSLEADKEKLRKEERRFNEWEEACKERNRVSAEIGRCEAAKDLTELARKTLKDTAPAVAQHLCSRIATRAQRVFNQINPEPIALSWNAENYSLCVTPGDRRFAMLSGGEQTKLALAMTLAMIEEFSGLRFCIFDEPTYGVDADSRHKLADAILQAQETAGFDQLLLVSHDDAFEGKIEHAVLLEKSAALGTSVVLTQ